MLKAAICVSMLALSFNVKAENQIDKSADKARGSFSITETTVEAAHQVALRAEYVYLLTLYTDILAARTLGDVANMTLDVVYAPEFVRTFAEKGVNMAVLWSPATLAAMSEYKKHFTRLTYAVPQSRAFARETSAFMQEYLTHVKYADNVASVNLAELLKATGRYSVKVAKIGGATVANYGLVAGAFYLSKDAISYTLSSRETLVQAQAEIVTRMNEIRKQLPEVEFIYGIIGAK